MYLLGNAWCAAGPRMFTRHRIGERNPKSLGLAAETAADLNKIRTMLGRQVPFSQFYVRVVRPVLLEVNGDV